MKELAIEILIGLALLVAVAIGSYSMAVRHTNNAWEAKEAKRQREQVAAERASAEAERVRSEKASGAYQAELLASQIRGDELERSFHAYKRSHSILAVQAPVAPAPRASPDDPAPVVSIEIHPRPEPRLSRGALWMWNSALLGRDAPAGTCGLADTSAIACAADAGVSLKDAWDNQALNARLCREDRLRHQRLIDYINGRKQ